MLSGMTGKNLQKSVDETAKLVETLGTKLVKPEDHEDNPLVGLTDMQLRFVEGYAALAGAHGCQTNAAKYAGYANPSVAGSQLIHEKKIIAALKHLTEHKAHAAAILAMGTLEDLMKTGTDAIRMKASTQILGYAGILLATVHRHEHTIEDNRSPEQIKKAIAEKAAELGLPVGDLLDITPTVGESNNPEGAPRYKRSFIPAGRQLTDDEIEDIDWLNVEVNK